MKKSPENGAAASTLSRRKVFAGAGAAGALAAAAAVVARSAPQAAEGAVADAAAPADAGYRVSDHVRRYYRTARV